MAIKIDTSKTQERHKTNTNRYAEEIKADITIESDCKRINMAFSDENYDYIQAISDDYRTSIVHLVNEIVRVIPNKDIDAFIKDNNIILGKTAPRSKGQKTKRINLRFTNENHSKLTDGALRHNTSASAYFNTIIKCYRLNDTI